MCCSKKSAVLVSAVLVVALALALAKAISLRGNLESAQRDAKVQAQKYEGQIANCNRTIADLKRRLDQMTKRYEEEYADRAALVDYLAGIQRKMDFAHPFGFSLRAKLDKSRIFPGGSYIRDGDYEKFETGDMLVDRDTMAFAKISGFIEPEEPSKDEKAVEAEYKARLDADFAKSPYPFPVSRRVWMEEGRLNFEIIDDEMMKKMEKREQRSLKESLDMMKAYRVSE